MYIGTGYIDNQGRVHYYCIVYCFLGFLILSYMILWLSVLRVQKQALENFMIETLFSASILERDEFSEKYLEQLRGILSMNGTFNLDFYQQQRKMEELLKQTKPVIATTLAKEQIEKMVVQYNREHKGLLRNFKLEDVLFYAEGKDGEYTPNGVPIRNTSIYMKLQFDVCNVFFTKQQASMEKCIEIVQ